MNYYYIQDVFTLQNIHGREYKLEGLPVQVCFSIYISPMYTSLKESSNYITLTEYMIELLTFM